MKLIFLVSGLGTRISEETKINPKALVKIGSKSIIWQLMKIYSYCGINESFIDFLDSACPSVE